MEPKKSQKSLGTGRTRRVTHGSVGLSSNREPFTSKVTEPPFLPQNYQREHSTVNLTLEKRIKDGVPLLMSSQVTKVPKEQRPGTGPLSDFKTQDRELVRHIHDKLWLSSRPTFVRKILESYDRDKSGRISREDLRAAMDRLHLGLSPADKDKVVMRLDPSNSGSVSVEALRHSFERPEALGGPTPDREEYNITTRAPWEARKGRFRAWNAQVRPQGVAGINDAAINGSLEQHKEDELLMDMLSERFCQARDKMRMVFRHADVDCNSRVEKHEFIAALDRLNLGVAKRQLERLFELADKDNSGWVDYEEFFSAFDSTKPYRALKPTKQAALGGSATGSLPLAQSMNLQQEDIERALRSPLTFELRRRLYTKHSAVNKLFKDFDSNGDAQLSFEEINKCAQALVPGIPERDVAALMVAADPNGDGYLNFREFVTRMVEDAAPHPRMVEATIKASRAALNATATASNGLLSSMSSSASSSSSQHRNGVGHSPIWNRPTTPESVRRARDGLASAPTTRRMSMGGAADEGADGDVPALLSSTSPRGVLQPSLRTGGSLGASLSVAKAPRSPLDVRDEAGEVDERKLLHQAAVLPVLESLDRARLHSSMPDFSSSMRTALSASGPTVQTGDAAAMVPARSLSQSMDTGAWASAGDGEGGGSLAGSLTVKAGDRPLTPGQLLASKMSKTRFYGLRYPDTRYITQPSPGTSQHLDPSDMYMPKSHPQYSGYQQEDKDRVAKHKGQAQRRYDASAAYVESRSVGDQVAAEAGEATRLAVKNIVKSRYLERMAMVDEYRGAGLPAMSRDFIFMRDPYFNEQETLAGTYVRTDRPTAQL